MRNPAQSTGAIEVSLSHCDVLNPAAPLPLRVRYPSLFLSLFFNLIKIIFVPSFGSQISPGATGSGANEELRLRHRFLDLRRPSMQHNLRTRAAIALSGRPFFHQLVGLY